MSYPQPDTQATPLEFACRYFRDPNALYTPRWIARDYLLQPMTSPRHLVASTRGIGATTAMTSRMLYHAMTAPGRHAFVVGPYKVCVQRVFETAHALLGTSPFVKSKQSDPWQITFTNGSTIRGEHTEHARKRQQSATIKGEMPTFIQVTDAGFMGRAALDALVPLFYATEPDVQQPEVWIESYPAHNDEIREFLARCAPPNWQNFWFPGATIVGTTDGCTRDAGLPAQLQRDIFRMLGADGFCREILAVYPDEATRAAVTAYMDTLTEKESV